MNKRILQIHPTDNVAVAVTEDLKEGDIATFGSESINVHSNVPVGHKIALRNIKCGEDVIKYGFPIGNALTDIAAGEWVHTHNLATSLGENLSYEYKGDISLNPCLKEPPTFYGYQRGNGDAGIRNELWIIPTVGCINGSAHTIEKELSDLIDPDNNIDDVIAFTHPYGCSQLGDDHDNTRRALAALARHPNAGGVIILGLGCENNTIESLKREIGNHKEGRIKFITAQDVDDEIEEGVKAGRELIDIMKNDRRTSISASKLKIGLKCGGSDGFSGLTANPLLGQLSDRVISWGAISILTEVPEMFGAETILMDRAVKHEVFEEEVRLINGFKNYFRNAGLPVYENPSPGNKAGGITTLEEKSLGCVQKGGTAPVVNVLQYGQEAITPGLNLLNAPGNDLVASTALALSGCHMVFFTTGRGTPFGTCVPTIKVSSNSHIASSKPKWIDFDAGSIIDNGDMGVLLNRLTTLLLDVAGGKKVKQEINRHKEIAIFKTGVTL